jgi:hypothetical protein
VFITTRRKHSRINVLQSVVDTRGSLPLMCMLLLCGTVWQVHMLAKKLGGKVKRHVFLSGPHKLLGIVLLAVKTRFVHDGIRHNLSTHYEKYV